MSYEAEQNVIGAILMDETCMDSISFIQPEMFEDAILGMLYTGCLRLRREGHQIDYVTLEDEAASDTVPADVVKRTIGDCMRNTMTSVTVRSHARRIFTEYRARLFRDAINNVTVDEKTIDEDIERLTTVLDGIRVVDDVTTKTLPQIVRENEDKYFKDTERARVQLGMPGLDDILGGLEGGDLIVIGARPAVGKSAFATQITAHFATIGKKVGYYNLEMQEKQVYERFIASRSGISITRIRRAVSFQNDEEERFREANEYLKKQDNIVISTGSKRISEIRADARKQHYDVIVIDYLQLVKPDVRYGANRYAEVGAISHAVKALAMEMDIPVIGLCQLNRASEAKEDKEPTMGELRESGDFEQDASVILLLWNTDKNDRSRKCIKVEKQRQGKTGKIDLHFDGSQMRFTETKEDGYDGSDGFMPAVDVDPVFD